MKNFIGTFEAAKLCQVSPGTLTRWIKEGRINASLTAGGHHRIAIPELVRFMEGLKIPVPSGMGEHRPPSVLIVDDEKEVRSMIRWSIESGFPGVKIDEAEDGFSAGWKCRDGAPDLLILDIHMRGFDGYQALELIRHFSSDKKPAILVISALIEPEVRTRSLELGADDYLQKPFDIHGLHSKIAPFLGTDGKGKKYVAA